jgi:hypothetical protein
MTCLGRWQLPLVVSSVFVMDRCFSEYLGRYIVDACDVDCIEVSELIQMASGKRLDATAPAEEVADAVVETARQTDPVVRQMTTMVFVAVNARHIR